MGKIIKNGKIYGSTNSKDIKYNPSKNVLSLKTNNVKDTIDKISEIIKNVKTDIGLLSGNQIAKETINNMITEKINNYSLTANKTFSTKKELGSTKTSLLNTITTKVSELVKTSDSKYATKTELSTNIKNKTDEIYKNIDSKYSTKTLLTNKISELIKSSDSKYATKIELSTNIKNKSDEIYKNTENKYCTKDAHNTFYNSVEAYKKSNNSAVNSNTNNINTLKLLKLHCYFNINTLKQDSTLVENIKIKTFGYFYAGDGGEAEYFISKSKPTNRPYVELDNKLFAVMVIPTNNTINVVSLGLNRWGQTDCSGIINSFIKFGINTVLYFPNGVYRFDSPIVVNDNQYLNMIGDTKLYDRECSYFNKDNIAYSVNNESVLWFNSATKNISFITIGAKSINTSFKGITLIDKDSANRFKMTDYSKRTTTEGSQFSYTAKYGHNGIYSNINKTKIDTCKFYGFDNFALAVTTNNMINNCVFRHCNISIICNGTSLQISNCDIAKGYSGINFGNAKYIKIYNTDIRYINTHAYYSNKDIVDLYIDGGSISDIGYSGIYCTKINMLILSTKMKLCGIFFAGTDIFKRTNNLSNKDKNEIYKKATFIYIDNLMYGNIQLFGYKTSMLYESSLNQAAPCLYFAGSKWKDVNIYGINRLELKELMSDELKNNCIANLYCSGK